MINKRYTKDKFSAFEYGLWRIKELEDELNKKWKRRGKTRTLMFYSQGDKMETTDIQLDRVALFKQSITR